MGWFLRETSQIPGHLKSTWDPFHHGLGSEFLLPEVITSGLLFAFLAFRTPANSNSSMCLHSMALFTVRLTHIILLLIKELSVRKSVGGSMCSINPKAASLREQRHGLSEIELQCQAADNIVGVRMLSSRMGKY